MAGSIRFDVLRFLRKAGYPVQRVIRVDSAGDSGAGFTEILFVTSDNRPHRGYVTSSKGKEIVWTMEGWDLPSGYEATP